MRIRSPYIFLIISLLAGGSLFAAKKAKMEKPKPIGKKPEIQRLEPRGVQRGIETRIQLHGTNFVGLVKIKSSNDKLKITVEDEDNENNTNLWIKINTPKDLPRGAYELSAVNGKGESDTVKLYVDDLSNVYESNTNSGDSSPLLKLPTVYWGTLNPAADSDRVEFDAMAGENLVFDLNAKSLGSKANITLTLFDPAGRPIASNNGFDDGDPLLSYQVLASGRYSMRIADEQMGGSPNHFYRLTIGELPLVVSAFPLSVKADTDASVELIGFNLPKDHAIHLHPNEMGDANLPVNLEKFRLRKEMKVLVTDQNELVESEPNNLPGEAMSFTVPAVINGRMFSEKKAVSRKESSSPESTTDTDLFRFHAKSGQVLVLETDAARRGSPLDTKIEILHPDGKPVERLLLESVRDSHLTFRPIDSFADNPRVENWQEMELNQFIYMQGEVCKIFRMPEGPDSGFQFYKNGNKRLNYFDTSATAHALDEPCYVVEPHPPGARLVPNGLPVFTLYYINDDDAEREIGTDSRLLFTAPADGDYLVRVTDNRGASGERFSYRLIVREAQPDFQVTLGGARQIIPPGSAQEFTFNVNRVDGFDDDITMEIANLPEGFRLSTPIVIEAGHLQASGTIFAATNAPEASKEALSKIKITATATIAGKKVVKEIAGFTELKTGEKPKLLVALEPYDEARTNFNEHTLSDKPMEITVTPGEVTPVWLKVKREGHDDIVTFTVDNLPHGVIVDNIGLNGVLIPKNETERQIFLRCAKWVPDTDRIAYCQAAQAGRPTSFPVLVHVRKHAPQQTASQ